MNPGKQNTCIRKVREGSYIRFCLTGHKVSLYRKNSDLKKHQKRNSFLTFSLFGVVLQRKLGLSYPAEIRLLQDSLQETISLRLKTLQTCFVRES